MIFDGDNMFFRKKALTAADITSDVLNVGTGEASDPLWLVQKVAGGSTGGKLTTVLQTSKDEAFTSPVVLGTYTETDLHTKIPRGNLGYLRLVNTSTYTAGTVTAALVWDDEVPW